MPFCSDKPVKLQIKQANTEKSMGFVMSKVPKQKSSMYFSPPYQSLPLLLPLLVITVITLSFWNINYIGATFLSNEF